METQDKNFRKIQRLLNLMDDDALTREEFTRNFKTVLDFLKKMEERNLGELTAMKDLLDKLYQRVKGEAEQTLTKTEEKALAYINAELKKLEDKHNRKMLEIDQKMGEVRDGLDADEEKVALEASRIALEGLLKQIPTIEAIENDLPKLGGKVRDSLELLEGEDKLEMKAVKGLIEELTRLRDELRKKKFATVYGGSSGGGHIVKAYDLTSQLNGVLKTFTLPAFWRVISVVGSSFHFTYRLTTDYTTSGSTITFTSEIDASVSLATGQTLIVIYSE